VVAPGPRNAGVVPHRENSAQGLEPSCRDCQHTHRSQNVQAK